MTIGATTTAALSESLQSRKALSEIRTEQAKVQQQEAQLATTKQELAKQERLVQQQQSALDKQSQALQQAAVEVRLQQARSKTASATASATVAQPQVKLFTDPTEASNQVGTFINSFV